MASSSREVHNERALATSSSVSSNHGKLKSKRAYYGLAITDIILGCGMIILGIVSISFRTGFYCLGHGIWCGFMVIIAGAFATAAFKNESSCLMKASLVLNITSSIFAGVSFIASILGAAFIKYGYTNLHSEMAVNIALIVICAFATVTSILLAVGSCKFESFSRCCCRCGPEAELAGQVVASGVVNKSCPLGMDSSPPTLEPTVAYVYCDGVMTPIDVFTPTGQSTRINPPTHITDVHKLGLANPGYLSECGDHAPPSYREL